jgi:hypothetical protein
MRGGETERRRRASGVLGRQSNRVFGSQFDSGSGEVQGSSTMLELNF